MLEFFDALVHQSFLRQALAAGLLASVASGLMGPYVVVRRIGYLAGGIAHSVLGGMGVAYYYGLSPQGGAVVGAVLAALGIGWASRRWSAQEDLLISALWSAGMATGIVFIARSPGYNVDLLGYLFGNILLVSPAELGWMAGLDLALAALVLLLHRQLLALCFDEEFARLRGVPVTALYLVLLCMVALAVVLMVQVVGLILVIALLTLPAAAAGHWVRSFPAMMALAGLIGVAATSAGLALAYVADLPAGAVMVLLTAGLYLGSMLLRGGRRP